MDPERRKQLEERREFNHARIAARALRERAEPAFSTLAEAGEDFQLRSLADARHWGPDWLTRASYVQWYEIPGTQWDGTFDDDAAKIARLVELVAEIAKPDDRILVCDQFQLELSRAAFERHVVAILEAAWRPYITAERAQWLIEVKGGGLWWKFA